MVKKIVELMNGDIKVHSKLGIGTSINLRIPYQEPSDILEISTSENLDFYQGLDLHTNDHLGNLTHNNISAKPDPITSKSLAENEKWSILVIDDNEVNCDVLAEILDSPHYKVTTSTSGKAGLLHQRKSSFTSYRRYDDARFLWRRRHK